jgi:hypothetical protein
MAQIYRIACAECGKGPPIPGISETEHRRGVSVVDSFIELTTSNGQQIPLGHPGESGQLEEHGYTWRSAQTQQRLHVVTRRICSKCGQLFLYREPYHSCSGCLLSSLTLLVSLSMAFAFVIVGDASAITSVALVMGSLVALSVVFQREDLTSAPLPPTSCGLCGSRTIPLPEVGTTRTPCPYCGAMAVTCEAVAIS